MALDPVDLVTILAVSIVFAEIYRRVLARRYLARAHAAIVDLAEGSDTPDVRLVRNLATAALGIAQRAILVEDAEGRWHLRKEARVVGARALQALGDLAPKGGGPSSPGTGIVALLGAAGSVELDQLVGLGISALPKRQQAGAAIVWGLARPIVSIVRSWLGAGGERKKVEGPKIRGIG